MLEDVAAERPSDRDAMQAIRVEHGGQRIEFPPQGTVVVGRDRRASVWLGDGRVSRRHLEIRPRDGQWLLVDLGSRNGTWAHHRRVGEVRLRTGDVVTVRVGDPDGPELTVAVVPKPRSPHRKPRDNQAPPSADYEASPRQVAIGRDADSDVVLGDPMVSRKHAVITVDRGAALHDLGSFNGTYLNGTRISGSVALTPGDVVGLGQQTLLWDGSRLSPYTVARSATLSARDLRVTTKHGKTLLDGVSLLLPGNSLTAVIGPSGAGKSTLLGALTGLRPASSGEVMWNGRGLYANYDQLRFHIGLVPQQDIQHPQLTVRQALRYAARLRLPPDTTKAEVNARVDHVASEMRLTAQLDQRIGTALSGGQRKRASIATELLTAPPLLFLDEPTSGLDPGLDQEVMGGLRALADDGRIVVVVTHSVLALQNCDRVLLLAPGGRVAYFGPPERLLEFFGCSDYPSVFRSLEHPGWVERFAHSSVHDRYVRESIESRPATGAPPAPPRPAPLRQLWTLIRRTSAVTISDRLLVGMLIAMPVVLALLARVVPGDAGLSISAAPPASREAVQRLTILIVGAALMGTSLTIREVVKERAIFRREYAVGLSPGAYLSSKVMIFGALAFLQAVALTELASVGVSGPDRQGVVPSISGGLEVALAVGAVAVAMSVAGLALSTLVRSSEQTMPLLVGVVMAQLVLSGALVPLEGRTGLEQIAWLAPARFGFAALGATVGLHAGKMAPGETVDPLYDAVMGQWVFDMAAVGLLALLCVGVAYWAMDRSASQPRG